MKGIKSIQPSLSLRLWRNKAGTITKTLPAPNVAGNLQFERRFIKGMAFLYSFYPHGPPTHDVQASHFN